MATIQDVLDCITALDAAVLAKANATNAVNTAAADADLDVTTELAALTPVLNAYNAALTTARANHGFPAAVTALETATLNEEIALYTMRDTMREYADSIT